MKSTKLVKAMMDRADAIHSRGRGEHTYVEMMALSIAARMVHLSAKEKQIDPLEDMTREFFDGLQVLAAGMMEFDGSDPRWERLLDRKAFADWVAERASEEDRYALATETSNPELRAIFTAKFAN